MKTVVFPGRFQPLHAGHRAHIQEALDTNNHVVVGIRDTKQDESNPYTFEERVDFLREAFGEQIEIIRIPDPDADLEIRIGRKVGFVVRRLPDGIEQISGTQIRANMARKGEI